MDRVLKKNKILLPEKEGILVKIQRFTIHDGPGIRTLVSLKGCFLKCSWCFNPETQKKYPEMMYLKQDCINCGECIKKCPYNAIYISGKRLITDREICDNKCYGRVDIFPCTIDCFSRARKVCGEIRKIEDIVNIVCKDQLLYKRTGGGVTISGGEPTFQSQFCILLAKSFKKHWIHTAIETCGAGDISVYRELLPWLDFIFLDIKHINSGRHKTLTGIGNQQILSNAIEIAKKANKERIPLVVRIPIIPGKTDSKNNVGEIASFVSKEMPKIKGIELMPYHKLGIVKYKSLGLEYELKDTKLPAEQEVAELEELIKTYGVAIIKYS